MPTLLASTPKISPHSVAKSGRVLYAFSSFYLPFYGCGLDFLFNNYDIFGCVSAAIYFIDELVEARSPTASIQRHLRVLSQYLGEKMEYDHAIYRLFDDARRYYRFEAKILQRHDAYSLADLLDITARRSFDFRLMHRCLLQLSARACDDDVFAWFRAFEIRMEIEDDLQSFMEDSLAGTFNVLSLAKSRCPVEASRIISNYLRSIDEELEARSRALSKAQQSRCRYVLKKYREIVKEIPVPE